VLLYGHLYGTGVQQWVDDENDVKIQFDYQPKKPEINNYNQLNFIIQDLGTGKHLKNLTASVTIPNSDPIYKFDNLTVADGDFGVICPFLDQGQHQVILSIRSENYALALASFNMTIPVISTV
jgi:hypothetical protein